MPRSVAAIVGGSLLITGGAAMHVVGPLLLVSSLGVKCDSSPCDRPGVAPGWGLTLGGVGAIAIGIPLVIWGARQVPIRTGSVPAWVGAPGGAGWRWRF